MSMPIKDIFVAKKRIMRFIYRTPLVKSWWISKRFDAEIYLKCENFQLTGSFKARGVFNKLLKLMEKDFKGKLVTVSTGNHGLAFGYASKLLGFDATVVLPENVVGHKLLMIKNTGVRILFHGSDYDQAEAFARELSREGYVFISPYNDLDIIAGQGTIGIEIVENLPNVEKVIVPVGGGGLISGIAMLLKETLRDVQVIGVQSEASAAMYYSLKAGKIVKVELKPSIADGLHGNIEENSITFEFVKRYVDDLVIVKEESIKKSMKLLYRYEGKIVEGSAAVTLASLVENRVEIEGTKTVLVLSGGNIDPSHLKFLVEE